MGTFRADNDQTPACDTCGKEDIVQVDFSNHPLDACIRHMRDTVITLTSRVRELEGRECG